MNVNLKLSGLYSSLFVIRFSLIFQKKFGGGGGKQKRALKTFLELYLNTLYKRHIIFMPLFLSLEMLVTDE